MHPPKNKHDKLSSRRLQEVKTANLFSDVVMNSSLSLYMQPDRFLIVNIIKQERNMFSHLILFSKYMKLLRAALL